MTAFTLSGTASPVGTSFAAVIHRSLCNQLVACDARLPGT
jgi:hypothetical protein